jgi:AcrR family transcriptional regulator
MLARIAMVIVSAGMASTDPAAARPKTEPIFPRLPSGPARIPPDQVARHQKARLEGAMVEAVARHGFAGTTLRELVTLAGVSKSTFYEHFESKEECFLSTFDEIVAQLSVRVADAYRSGDDFRAKLVAGLQAFMDLAVEEPAAASLAAVESLTIGAPGVEHRERASEAFEALIQQSYDSSPSDVAVSPVVVRGVVGGVRGVAYRRLRANRPEELPPLVGELAEWVLRYQQPDSEATARAVAAAERPGAATEEAGDRPADEQPGWDEPPDSRASRRALTQRERILRGAALVVVEKGYAALSIPAISAAAGTSNQTFYEHFDSKRDAFLAAFEVLVGRAFGTAAAAFAREGDRPEAVGAGLRALLEHIAGDELFARLAFFELPTAGPVALDRADATMDSFSAFLEPGQAPSELGANLPRAVLEAIPTGTWAVLQHEIAHGRRESLPDLAPDLTRIALAPFGPG